MRYHRGWMLIPLFAVLSLGNCQCDDRVEHGWTLESPERMSEDTFTGIDIDTGCSGGECTPCLGTDRSKQAWQIHRGEGPECWPKDFDLPGEREVYQFAEIPESGDSGWSPEPDNFISFDEQSTMCDDSGGGIQCECRSGGDFTYFQTFFEIPPSLDVESLRVRIENVDDGARITIFNSEHPDGVVDPDSYAFLGRGGNSTTDLSEYLATGTNRIVVTHVDDCCKIRRIEGVYVTLNGRDITRCTDS